MTDKFTAPGFADYFVGQRKHHDTFLDKIDKFIDWKPVEKILRQKYKKTASADSRPAYPPLPMFKFLLLQRWYKLSDPGLEEALDDRISFIRFSDFSLVSSLPDHSTICRFRNALLELDMHERFFKEINRQLESGGMPVKEGAIVDATIIESSRRPGRVMEIMPEDRKEEKSEIPASVITCSDDPDANWIKKGKRTYYGGTRAIYRLAQKRGLSWEGILPPPALADTTELEKTVSESHIPEGSIILADKGYASVKNREVLAGRKLKDGIMHKAARNKPLTPEQNIINRLISSVRYRIEQSIGTLKRGYQFFRMRYKGLKKGNMELLLNAMAFNLEKAAAMME